MEPVLVVIGKKDIQADWQADVGALETAAARGGNVTFAYPSYADHVLKHEEKPRDALVAADVGARYNSEGRRLDPEMLTGIVDWLNKQTRQ